MSIAAMHGMDSPPDGELRAASVASDPRSTGESGSDPRSLVHRFLTQVRSGQRPDRAALYLAPTVLAHQLTSEGETAIARTPDQYADHVRDLVESWGPFSVCVDELLVDGDRVYARWTQLGHDRVKEPRRHIRQITSAVYRIDSGRIIEYWIQIDRLGVELQRRDAYALHAWSCVQCGDRDDRYEESP